MTTTARSAMTAMFMGVMTLAGCMAADDTPRDMVVEERASAQVSPAAGVASPGPAPVASLALTSGQTVEFYDFGGAALIVETGAAYSSPAVNAAGAIPADQLTEIWTRLAPGAPVPPALANLQHRLTSMPERSAAPGAVASTSTGAERPAISGTVQPDAPDGCSNGCCDAAWLLTLAECQSSGWDYSWFLYNGGWSTATSTDDIAFQGLVCSAQGTSTFAVSIGGSSGTWNIPEATYHWFHWTAGTDLFGSFNPKSLSSSVNSTANQHLHTYCGRVLYD